MQLKIELHKYQKQALCSNKRIVACVAGLQSGKTFGGSIWTRMMLSMPDFDPRDTGIVCSPTYRLMASSTLPAFLSINNELGRLNKSEMIFTLWDGRKIFLRAMDNEWSCEGITRCKFVWLDEAGLFSDQAWINLMGRASPQEAPMMITTTPYHAWGWLYQMFEQWREGERDDVDFLQWTSADNPHYPKKEYERQMRLLDPRMFAMRFKGIFSRMAGLVYIDFSHHNIIPPQPIKRNKYHIVGGCDWGTANPMAIVIRAISKDGRHDYQIAEYKKSGLSADEQCQMVLSYHKRYRVDSWIGDSADPGMIALCQTKGVPIVGIDKPSNSVQFGIGLHQELIRTRYHKIFSNCSETEREYSLYAYPEIQTNKPVSDNPIKMNDHCFVRDTLITTIKGQVPIQYVKPGDLVLTRLGYRPVVMTHEHEAEAFDYGILKCTPNHKIFTQSGFKQFATLMPNDIYYSIRRCLWSRLLNGMVRSITGIRILREDPIGFITGLIIRKVPLRIFTGINGNSIMVRFLRVILFIIKMVIRVIMTLIILSLRLVLSMLQIMLRQIPILNQTNKKNISIKSDPKQKNGMGQKPGMNGIKNILKKIKRSCMGMSPLYVNSVKNISKIDHIQNSVQINVKPDLEENLVLMMLKENAVTATKFSPSINTPKKLGVIPVYNLTVKDIPEYFANDILVHNCMDATRYITMHYRHLIEKVQHPQFTRPKTHLEKLLAGEFSSKPDNYDGLD